MKTIIFVLLFVLGTHQVQALNQPTKKTMKAKSTLSTDVKFGDQTVGGKYQLPMEALSVVENEKSIDDLINVRKNFHDRTERSKGLR